MRSKYIIINIPEMLSNNCFHNKLFLIWIPKNNVLVSGAWEAFLQFSVTHITLSVVILKDDNYYNFHFIVLYS